MDAHLIYTASDRIKNKVTWITMAPDSEWIYFGVNEEIDKQVVISAIQKHFAEDTLYIAFTRAESMQTTKKDVEKAIDKLLGFDDFFVWDINFKKVIEI